MNNHEEILETWALKEVYSRFPSAKSLLENFGLEDLAQDVPLLEAIDALKDNRLDEFGMDGEDIFDALLDLFEALQAQEDLAYIREITVLGGHDKNNAPEEAELIISQGEVVSIVGPTGAGKSRLLADIECAAKGDTPTGRRVLFDGHELDDTFRFGLGNHLIAQLSQNMNFVMDVSVRQFLQLHAQSRGIPDGRKAIEQCVKMANDLSGEQFGIDIKITQLSGGQSRALMIADAACMSPAPILLIDEIENAGIDRLRAVELLKGHNKIVLLSTHDPLLALSADKRVVLGNGGIREILVTTDKEQEILAELAEMDQRIAAVRTCLRKGGHIISMPEKGKGYVGVI